MGMLDGGLSAGGCGAGPAAGGASGGLPLPLPLDAGAGLGGAGTDPGAGMRVIGIGRIGIETGLGGCCGFFGSDGSCDIVWSSKTGG